MIGTLVARNRSGLDTIPTKRRIPRNQLRSCFIKKPLTAWGARCSMDSIKSDFERTELLLWTRQDRACYGISLASRGTAVSPQTGSLVYPKTKNCRGGEPGYKQIQSFLIIGLCR